MSKEEKSKGKTSYIVWIFSAKSIFLMLKFYFSFLKNGGRFNEILLLFPSFIVFLSQNVMPSLTV